MRPRHPLPVLGRDGDWLIDEPPEQEPQGAYRSPNANTWAGGFKPPPPIPPWSPEHEVAIAFLGKLCDRLEAEPGEFYGYSGGLRVCWHLFRQRPEEIDRKVLLQHLQHLAERAAARGRADLATEARDVEALASTCPLEAKVDGVGGALLPAGRRLAPEPV